jgi:hypothetical protein
MKFEIGERVICISAAGDLIKGNIYTVAHILYDGDGILLYEIQPSDGFDAFNIKRFKKLDPDGFADKILEEIKKSFKELEYK